MKFLHQLVKSHYLFLVILILVIVLRLYRLDILTTFGRDQGVDFLTIRDIAVNHKLTLIGIKTSIGDFFQGPDYLYIILPLFLLLNLNPIAGTLTAVLISLLTLTALYIFLYKFFNKTTAVIGALIFSVSPEFTKYGITPISTGFTVLFLIVSLYFIKLRQKGTAFLILAGIATGISMELHFLMITFALAVLGFLVVDKNPKNLLAYLFGLAIGLAPTELFELRHNFLNTHYLLNYLHTPSTVKQDTNSIFNTWVKGAADYLGAKNTFLGAIALAFGFLSIIKIRDDRFREVKIISFFVFPICLFFSFFMSTIEPHYLITVWVLLIISSSIFLSKKAGSNFQIGLVIFVVLNLGSIIPFSLYSNHGYDMPMDWNLREVENTGNIIRKDSTNLKRINVASLLDGDTRAYPLRYVLSANNTPLEGVENYPQTDHLYVVAASKESILKNSPWEIYSLAPYIFGKTWQIDRGVYLYRLDRLGR